MLGAEHVLGIDVDPAALVTAQANTDDFDELPVSFSSDATLDITTVSCCHPANAQGLALLHDHPCLMLLRPHRSQGAPLSTPLVRMRIPGRTDGCWPHLKAGLLSLTGGPAVR